MSLIIENGDFKRNERGIPVDAEGAELALAEAECMLKMPRGSFFYSPAMGSRIPGMNPLERENADALALEYAAEAVQKIKGVRVCGAHIREDGKAALIALGFGEIKKEVSVAI